MVFNATNPLKFANAASRLLPYSIITPFSAIKVARSCIPIGKTLHISRQDFATAVAEVLISICE